MSKKRGDAAAVDEALAPAGDAAAADPKPSKRFAVNYKHSLLGERVIAADTPDEAVAKYNQLCDGFKSEHAPEVRELKPEGANVE